MHLSKGFRLITVIILILGATCIFRFPFLQEPLDRDSGEFAMRGYAWGHGYMPYKDLSGSRPPGLDFLFFILFKLFPPDYFTVNLFVMFWAILNAILVYLLSRILFNNFSLSCLAIVLYVFFSSSPFIEGTHAMTDFFVTTFAMLAFYFLIIATKKNRLMMYVLPGLCFGVGFLFKQSATFEFLSAVVYLFIFSLLKKEGWMAAIKKNTAITSAFLFPFALCLSYFQYKGILNDFIFSVFIFNINYIKLLGYQAGNFWGKFIYFNSKVFKTNSIIWIGAVVFFLILLLEIFTKKLWKKEIFIKEKDRFMLGLWGLFSFLGLCSSSRFFPHYYIALIPSFVLMTVYTLRYLWMISDHRAWRAILSILILFALSWSLYFHYDYYFKFSPNEISINKYNWEPFVEAKELGLYIRQKTQPGDFIFVWAEEPEIHFYALRFSPCKSMNDAEFVYYRAMFKDAEDILISSLRNKKPKYFVIDTKHIKVLDYNIKIKDFIESNYFVEKEFKIIRNGVWGYSLLACRLKQ